MKGRRFPYRTAPLVLLLGLVACATVTKAEDFTDPQRLQVLVTERTRPYLLLDVRTPAEFRTGHIPSARNIPFDKIQEEMPRVGKNSLVIVYCASGGRASIAAETLAKLGYTNVVDFGAISSWPGKLVTDE